MSVGDKHCLVSICPKPHSSERPCVAGAGGRLTPGDPPVGMGVGAARWLGWRRSLEAGSPGFTPGPKEAANTGPLGWDPKVVSWGPADPVHPRGCPGWAAGLSPTAGRQPVVRAEQAKGGDVNPPLGTAVGPRSAHIHSFC